MHLMYFFKLLFESHNVIEMETAQFSEIIVI